MEIEAIADAWYVWVGVTIVSVGVAGIVVALPAQPPPDATAAINAADRAAASEYGTRLEHDHDATAIRIGTRQLSLRNEAGSDHASVVFGSLTPVPAAKGKTRIAGEALLSGEPPGRVVARNPRFGTESQLRDAFRSLRDDVDRRGAQWRPIDGPIRIRSVRIGGETVVLVGL